MFHRNQANGPSNKKQQSPKGGQAQDAAVKDAPKEAPRQIQTGQTPVERYAKTQQQGSQPQGKQQGKVPPANQNRAAFYAQNNPQNYVQPYQREKEPTTMNMPTKTDAQANETQQAGPQGDQGRMDIPGGTFQRPGQPQGGRPAYPGAYPGSAAPAAAQAQPQNYASQTPASEPARSTGRKLVIGEGITMSGEIEACDHLIVEGTVEAALKGASMMDIAESGAFYGTVEIEEATIAGRFEGDLTVKGRLTIRESGAIIGAVAYGELEVEAGATLDGKINPLNSKAAQSGSKGSKAKRAQNGEELPFAEKAVAAE